MMEMLVFRALLVVCLVVASQCEEEPKLNGGLLVITVATEANDGFTRFIRSTKKHDLTVEVLGMGAKWEGGNMEVATGGGQKVNLLRTALKKYKDRDDLVIMFVDSYDVVVTAGEEAILSTFNKFKAKVVFSAEGFCWPDISLANLYPPVKINEKRFLNSGGFIGYAPQLFALVSGSQLKSDDDDQLFYTIAFLTAEIKTKLGMKLDTRSEIFQNFNGALDEVQIKFKGASAYIYNSKTGTIPLILHGNGPIKVEFNRLMNYAGDQWTPTQGCQGCAENTISLQGVTEEDMPLVFMAVFVATPASFLDLFFTKLVALAYPKSRMDVFVYYGYAAHREDVHAFLETHGSQYKSANTFSMASNLNDWTARNKALEECEKRACQYYFSVDGDAHLTDVNIITKLIERNRTVIGPALSRKGKLWSNWWGALSSDGFYKRTDDYTDIVQGGRQGVWNVPFLSQAFLVQGHSIPDLHGKYINGRFDQDMALCKSMREKGMFLHVDNTETFGFLVNSENYQIDRLHSDLYSVMDNKELWEEKYAHPEHRSYVAKPVNEYLQPCPDVFWMPFGSATFCRHFIEEMEHYGQWSGGGHKKSLDERLGGGYENVPTVDIHTNQIAWEQQWLQLLVTYVAPFNQKVYDGYYTEARATMNFAVRYKPGEQDHLKPHSDSSTYTVNVALNQPGVDYEGGGVRFLRYNCSVTETRVGWLLMHPGRLTHQHEGLYTTAGTRYIMVSFIDP